MKYRPCSRPLGAWREPLPLLFGALWLRESVTPGLLAALATVVVGIVRVNRGPAS